VGDEESGEFPGEPVWLDDPPLPPVNPRDPHRPPPAERILVRGAQLVRVHFPDHPNPKLRGFIEVVVLAWARIPNSEHWAGLCVWLGTVQEPGPHGAHTTGAGRYAWLRMLPDRVQSWRPPHRYLECDAGWHGMGEPGQVSDAIARAAATLPEELRQAALTPRDNEQRD
jgi:hypothetical protein